MILFAPVKRKASRSFPLPWREITRLPNTLSHRGRGSATTDLIAKYNAPASWRKEHANSKFLSSYLILILLWMLVCAVPVQAQVATVRGFVTSRDDGQGLEGVNVVLRDANGRLKGAATSVDGLYIIPSIPPGRYAIRATSIGFQAASDSLTLAPGEVRMLNFELVPRAEELVACCKPPVFKEASDLKRQAVLSFPQ